MTEVIKIDISGMEELTQFLVKLDGIFRSARYSAIGSVGFFVRNELREWIKKGGENWKPLGPIGRKFKQRKLSKKWYRLSRKLPSQWVRGLIKYNRDPNGNYIVIDARRKAGDPDYNPDIDIVKSVRKSQSDRRIKLTPKMRRKFAVTRLAIGRGKMAGKRRKGRPLKPGVDFFPIKKSTTALFIPGRDIFATFQKKIDRQIVSIFEEKFWASIQRKLRI